MSLISQARDSSELIRNLTAREVKGKYKSTALGQMWSLVTPIANMLVYTLVFSFIMGIQAPVGDPSGQKLFAVHLMCALLPWAFFANVVNGGMSSLVGNENLIKKVYFPRWALLVSTTFAAMNQWAIEMALLALAIVLIGVVATAGGAMVLQFLPLVVVTMVVLAVFALGVALALSIANVYFRDTQHFVSIVLQIWFYLTPILYAPTLVTDKIANWVDEGKMSASVGDTALHIYEANPMYAFASVFRSLLYHNTWPRPAMVVACLAWAAVSISVGTWVFRRHQGRLAEAL